MSYEFGHCRVEELSELVALTNRVFRNGRPGDMGAEYPLVFNEENVENLLVARFEGRIVAHVGLCLRDATILGAPLRVASIGAVATDPAHRGHGSATVLMANAREQAVRLGASLMLISGLRGLYRRLGYVQVGDFRRYTLPAGAPDPRLDVTLVGEGDLADVVRLHQSEPVRFLRSAADWRRLLAAGMLMNHPADLLLVREHGLPVAYVGVQRPDSPLDPTKPVLVKEFGGSRTALTRTLPGIAAHYQASTLELIASASDLQWNAVSKAHWWIGAPLPFPGTLGIIDVSRFLVAVGPLLEERVGNAVLLVPEGAGARLEVEGETVLLENPSLLTTLIFGSESYYVSDLTDLPSRVRSVIEAALPLPLLWYGYNYV